jgi:hypothetical protein
VDRVVADLEGSSMRSGTMMEITLRMMKVAIAL